jgi:hypothetical protein
MESTWERRDLPVLDAIVRYFDEHDGPEIPDAGTFAKLTGVDAGQVGRAVRALGPRFVKTGPGLGGLTELPIMGVTDEARQAVEQWPSPEIWVERLVQALREAAEREPDPERRGRLRTMAEGLGGFARDVAVGVLSGGSRRALAAHSVPTDWGPVVQTAIGAVAAIGGGFIGAWWQARGQ